MHAASLALALLLGAEPENVLYDFGAPDCIHCQHMNPIVDRLIEEGYPIIKVNCRDNRELPARFGVDLLPTFVLVINGREVDRSVGGPSDTPESRLRQMLSRIPTQTASAEGASRPSGSSAAPPSTRHAEMGEPGPFPEAAASAATPPVNAPRPESPAPPIPPAGGVPRNEFAPLDHSYVPEQQDSSQGTARGSSDNLTPPPASSTPGIASMAASVRIRVIQNGRVDLGSGTLIVSQQGRSLIITCGHLFRNVDQSAKIEVDIFSNGQSITYVGELLAFDLEAEVGLITIPTEQVLPVAKVASIDRVPQVQERVASIGCSGGKDPSREQHRITAINKYEGPDNIECSGTPVQGRSGGGLFNSQEELVGICFSAGVDEPLGLYAGPKAIYAMLDKYGLAALYAPQIPQTQQNEQLAGPGTTGNPFAGGQSQGYAIPPAELGPPSNQPLQPIAGIPGDRSFEPSSSIGGPTTTEPLDFDAGEAEVVCLITEPDGSRRVVVLHRASPKFVAYLNGELDANESISVLEDSSFEPGTVELTAQRTPRPDRTAMMTYTVATQQPAPRAYSTEGFQPTSLVQPMQPRPFVRRR